MKHNMGNIERAMRVLVGAFVALFGLLNFDTSAIFWGGVRTETVTGLIISLVGLIMFVTGAFAYCPMNAVLHANSCEACRLGETHMHKPI